jgi:hypothetical protein
MAIGVWGWNPIGVGGPNSGPCNWSESVGAEGVGGAARGVGGAGVCGAARGVGGAARGVAADPYRSDGSDVLAGGWGVGI